MQKLRIPSDWNGEDANLVTMCVPNSPQWRAIVSGAIYQLSRGRVWDETTGNIISTQEIGLEIWESITMVCNEDLTRIADALEEMNGKFPTLVSVEDMLEAIQDVPGVDFTQLEALLNILGALPGVDIKIDPLKMALDWISTGQFLSNEYAQSTSLAAIASTLAAGTALQAALNAILAAKDGGQLLLDGILAGSSAITALTDVIDLFVQEDTENGAESARAGTNILNDVFVEGDAINVSCAPAVNVSCGSCSGGAGAPGGGSLVDEDEAEGEGDPEIDPPPAGFDDWEEYYDYKCKAAEYIVEASEAMFKMLAGVQTEATGLTAGAIAAVALNWMVTAATIWTASGGTLVAGAGAITLFAGSVVAGIPLWIIAGVLVSIAAMLVLAGIGALVFFFNVVEEFETLREQAICDLYASKTVEEAREALSDKWEEAITALVIDEPFDVYEAEIKTQLQNFISLLVTNSFLNCLFERSSTVDNFTALIGCTGCSQGCVDITQNFEQNTTPLTSYQTNRTDAVMTYQNERLEVSTPSYVASSQAGWRWQNVAAEVLADDVIQVDVYKLSGSSSASYLQVYFSDETSVFDYSYADADTLEVVLTPYVGKTITEIRMYQEGYATSKYFDRFIYRLCSLQE